MSASALTPRRLYSTPSTEKESDRNGVPEEHHHPSQENGQNKHTHDHHEHHHHNSNHDHEHTHSHSIFGSLTHTHIPGENGHSPDAEKIVEALKGGGDRGSQITLVGLASNVGLTAAKGAAGWYMNSAALLADAGHSLSDLLGDFVTLFCWKLSRRPPSDKYPYGFGKFEVLGTTTISLLLTGGAIGIGIHSWSLFSDALTHTASHMSPGILHDLILQVSSASQQVPVTALAHSHTHALDPNAAWFAGISVIAKEWLYRITKKVADEERSPVLLANAVHHRSDAYSSLVAFVAILGSWWFPHLPLDPIGGLIVSVLIFRQGWVILMSAFTQLTDGSVSTNTKRSLLKSLDPILPSNSSSYTIPDSPSGSHSNNLSPSSSPTSSSFPESASHSDSFNYSQNILGIKNLRAMRAGALMFVDVEVEVPSRLSIGEAKEVEDEIERRLREKRKEIKEVRIKFYPIDNRE